MKHTPGPWKVDELGVITCGIKGTCKTVAETMYCRWLNSQAYAAGEPRKDFEKAAWCGKQAETAKANGFMIAAAPEMADHISLMLRTVQDTLRHGLTDGQREALEDMCREAQAILRKIGGTNAD